MSQLEQKSGAVCCSSGSPKNSASAGAGSVSEIDGIRYYVTGSDTGRGIVAAYDIFGFDIGQTREFLDDLAQRASATVLMPDLLGSQAWPLAEFPPKDSGRFSDWLSTSANADTAAGKILGKTVPALRQRLAAGAKIGIVGFCWGARVSLTVCGADSDAGIACCACVHPAFVSEEAVAKLQVPLALLPAEDDPDMEAPMRQLEARPFFAKCVHRRFTGVQHGFCAARGDRADARQRKIIDEACQLVAKFLLDNA